MKLYGIIMISILTGAGCTIVAATDKTLVQDQAAVGVNVISRWSDLTDDQKKEAYWKSTRGYHTLNYTLWSVPVPLGFKTDPWTTPVTGPTAPPVVAPVSTAAHGGH
jgi:hypothetical protein